MATTTITDELERLATGVQSFLTTQAAHIDDKELPFLSTLEKMGIEGVDGFRQIIPYAVGEHFQTITEFSTGYEVFDTTVRPIQQKGEETFYFYGAPVAISFLEEAYNSGSDAGKVKIIDSRTEAVRSAMRRRMNRRLLGWTGTGFSGFIPVNGDDVSTGIIESDDVGSQTNTVHGISKSGIAVYPHGQNQSYDCGGLASAELLEGIDSVLVEGKKVGIESNLDRQRTFYSEDAYKNLLRRLRPNETYTSAEGRRSLNNEMVEVYRGRKILVESDMPNAGTATATKPWSVLGVHFDDLAFCAFSKDMSKFGLGSGKMWFRAGAAEKISEQPVIYTPVMVGGNLMAVRPEKRLSFGRHFIIVDADAY